MHSFGIHDYVQLSTDVHVLTQTNCVIYHTVRKRCTLVIMLCLKQCYKNYVTRNVVSKVGEGQFGILTGW